MSPQRNSCPQAKGEIPRRGQACEQPYFGLLALRIVTKLIFAQVTFGLVALEASFPKHHHFGWSSTCMNLVSIKEHSSE